MTENGSDVLDLSGTALHPEAVGGFLGIRSGIYRIFREDRILWNYRIFWICFFGWNIRPSRIPCTWTSMVLFVKKRLYGKRNPVGDIFEFSFIAAGHRVGVTSFDMN